MTSKAGEDYETKVRERLGASGPAAKDGKPLEAVYRCYLQQIAIQVEEAQQELPDGLQGVLQRDARKKMTQGGESIVYEVDAWLQQEVGDVVKTLGPLAELLLGPALLPSGTVIEATVNSAGLLTTFHQLEQMLLLRRENPPSHVCVVANRTAPDCQMDELLPTFPQLKRLAQENQLTIVHWSHAVPVDEYQRVLAAMDAKHQQELAAKDAELAAKDAELAAKDRKYQEVVSKLEKVLANKGNTSSSSWPDRQQPL